jgi:hypothetical protein
MVFTGFSDGIMYKEKQIASFGNLCQKIKQIADEANKRYPNTERVIK